MTSSKRGTDNKKAPKAADDDGRSVEKPAVKDIDKEDAEYIEKQIGTGLRSMYANVLSEDLPEDLIAMVNSMASKEKEKASKEEAKTPKDAHKPAKRGVSDG